MNVRRNVCAVIDPGSGGCRRSARSAFAAFTAGAMTRRLMLRRSRRAPLRVGNAGSSSCASARVTGLVRAGNDLVLVAELAGHRRLETTRRYSLPSKADRQKAVSDLEIEF